MDPAPEGRPHPSMLRRVTDRAVLAEVLRLGAVSRAELSRLTGLARPTTSAAVRRLTEAGVVGAAGREGGRRGRTSTLYALAPEAGWVLAMDVRHESVTVRAADLAGRVWFAAVDETPAADAAAALRRARRAARGALHRADGHGRIRAVAVAAANPVDPRSGRLLPLTWSAFPDGVADPRRLLPPLPGVPLLVDNGVNLAAAAERHHGAAQGLDDLAYVFVGSGIGMGLVVGGRTVRGAHGLAGEVGYLTSGSVGGPVTPLVSTLASGRHRAPSALDVAGLRAAAARADAGDAAAAAEVAALGDVVGRIIADTAAIVDPGVVLLGGPLGTLPAVVAAARSTVADVSPVPVRIEPGACEHAAVDGALLRGLDVAVDAVLAC